MDKISHYKYKWVLELENGDIVEQSPNRCVNDYKAVKISLIPKDPTQEEIYMDIPIELGATPVYFKRVTGKLFGMVESIAFNIGYEIDGKRTLESVLVTT